MKIQGREKMLTVDFWLVCAWLLPLLLGCNKEKAAEPITVFYPLSYFPAYPGSYWKYVDSNGDTTEDLTDNTYKPDAYTYPMASFTSDVIYVPFYNSIPIWGYEAHTGPISNAGSYPFTRILSDSLPVGTSWVVYHWGGTGISRKTIVKDTTLVVSGTTYTPVIGVEEYYSQGPSYYIWIAKRYYCKDVGLIREDFYNSQDSTINSRVLIDCYINN